MAVKCPTSSDYLQRTTNIVQPSSAYTCIFWMNTGAISTNPAYQTAFITLDNPSVYSYFAALSLDNTELYLSLGNGSSYPIISTTTPSTNIWIPIVYARSGSTHTLFVNGVALPFTTLNISAGTFGYTLLGNDTFSDGNISLFSFKEWNVELNNLQILAEINSPGAVINSSGLVTFTPLVSDLLDISGNGNNWTAIGSPTFIAGPTLPANITSTTAITISSLPYTNTQSVLVTGAAYAVPVWYKYITVTGDNILGPFAYSSGYAPICNVLESDLSDYITGFSNNANAALLMPSEGVSTTYYFEIVPNAPQVSSATLTFSLVRHVDVTAPIGTVAISSDIDTDNNYDLPLALLNPNADGVLAFVNPFHCW